MTPQPNTKIKLSELNTLLDEMQQGEAAIKKLAEMDKSMGMQSPQEVIKKMRGPSPSEQAVTSGDAMGDSQLAANLRQQAEKMNREAQGLMAESQRLLQEAASLDPVKAVKASKSSVVKTKKVRTKVAV